MEKISVKGVLQHPTLLIFNCKFYFVGSRATLFAPNKRRTLLHLMKFNYRVGEWKGALNATQSPEDPDEKGWELKDETLAIKWMGKNPAPEEILQFATCSCKKTKCTSGQCKCYAVKLKCINLCSCARCENMVGDHDDDEKIDEQGASDDDYDSGTDGS